MSWRHWKIFGRKCNYRKCGNQVIDADCKTIVGYRLKQSGMRWSLRGASAIIALRCAQLRGRWEEFWELHLAGEP